ncbi:MAG: chemotaxis protein CheX [Syntrophaceae bacterium]|nr:chemotaxis protein CheX [Syntrophaceae bacterium]
MKKKIETVLQEAAIKTFEDICFMYLEPELRDSQKNLEPDATTEVKFRGGFSGKLIIESRGGLVIAAASNMLSNDHPSLQQQMDALGEIANIICGNIVPSLGRGKGKGNKIESPRFLNKDELLKEEKGHPFAEVTLNFNQGRADIKLFVDNDNPVKEITD